MAAVDEFLELLPVDSDTIDAARARLDADANAGLSPGDDDWTDTSVGLFFNDHTQAALLEVMRLRDYATTEMLAAALLPLAYGDLLDQWGEALQVPRTDEIAATGRVTFTAPNGTQIPSGVELAVPSDDADADDVKFLTAEATATGGIAPLAPPAGLAETVNLGDGALAAGTYHYVVTALVGGGETTISNRVAATLSGTGRVALVWEEVPGAAYYRVYRGASGSEKRIADDVLVAAYNDAGAAAGAIAFPGSNGTGGAWALPVVAESDGPSGNVPAGAIKLLMSAVDAVSDVENEFATAGGYDVEPDEAYLPRLLLEYRGSTGSGTIADYERWCLADPGVGSVTVEAIWNGAGTVRCTLLDPGGDPATTATVARVQADLDPVAGKGMGRAPIGAIVTVTTPTIQAIVVAATVVHDSGYSLTGAGGTVATRSAIEDAIAEYVDALEPGDDVVLHHVQAQFFKVKGVHEVSGLTLNGSAADVTVSSTQVAQLTRPATLS